MSDERDDLDQLLHSAGWQRFRERVKLEWGAVPYALRLETAAQSPESAKQVYALISTRQALDALLAWPTERIAAVTRHVEAAAQPESLSRGGVR